MADDVSKSTTELVLGRIGLTEGHSLVGEDGLFTSDEAAETVASKINEFMSQHARVEDPIKHAGFESAEKFDERVLTSGLSDDDVKKLAEAGLPADMVKAYADRTRLAVDTLGKYYRTEAAAAIAGDEFRGGLSKASERVESLLERVDELAGESADGVRERLANGETVVDAIKELHEMANKKDGVKPSGDPGSGTKPNLPWLGGAGGLASGSSSPGQVSQDIDQAKAADMAKAAARGYQNKAAGETFPGELLMKLHNEGKIDYRGRVLPDSEVGRG